MVNAAILVFSAVIAYNAIFQFFTVREDLLLKWENQRDNCSGNASSTTTIVGNGEKKKQFSNLIFLDTQKIKLLRIFKANTSLKTFKLMSIS